VAFISDPIRVTTSSSQRNDIIFSVSFVLNEFSFALIKENIIKVELSLKTTKNFFSLKCNFYSTGISTEKHVDLYAYYSKLPQIFYLFSNNNKA
jgi:hypothetical protein